MIPESIHYNTCPVCASGNIKYNLSAKDNTFSGEVFEIWECSTCSLRFTQNIPPQSYIGGYYHSEDYISHSDTRKGFINKIYHSVRKFSLKSKRRIVEFHTHLENGNLLDVGAGTGNFAAFMQRSAWQVTALEPDPETISRAANVNRVYLRPIDELFNLTEDSFDVITMWHVLEHVHQLHEYVEQIKKVIKPAGVIFIAVPNYTSFDASYYKNHWAAYDVPRHLYHFSPPAMQLLLKRHSLNIKSIRRMWFDSFYVSFLSEKYKTGSANIVKGFWYGAISNLHCIFKKKKCSSLIYIVMKN